MLGNFKLHVQALCEKGDIFLELSDSESSIHEYMIKIINQQKIEDDEIDKKKVSIHRLTKGKGLTKESLIPSPDDLEINNDIGLETSINDRKKKILLDKEKKKVNKIPPPKLIRPSIVETGEGILKLFYGTLSEEDKRLMMGSMEPLEVNTKKNLATILMGPIYAEATLDFFIFTKNNNRKGWIKWIIYCSWAVGSIVGLISLTKLIQTEWGAVGALMGLPNIIINGIFPLMTDILQVLVIKFDTWYMIYNMFGAFVGLCFLFQDFRILFLVKFLAVDCPISALWDALPSKIRIASQILGMGAAFLIMTAIQIGLYYDFFQNQHFEYNLGAIKFTASSFASTCLTNVMIYYVKNIGNAIFDPESLVVIRSKVKTLKMNDLDSRLVRATHHLNEIRNLIAIRDSTTSLDFTTPDVNTDGTLNTDT